MKVLPTGRKSLSAVLVLGAALALTACGPQQAGAAAIVGDRVISDKDIQTAAQETNKGVQGLRQPITSQQTLRFLIIAPYLLDAAAKGGHGVSESEAKQVLSKLPNPSPATIEFVRAILASQLVTPEEGQVVESRLRKAHVTVNPRYGKLDLATLQFDTTPPNWIKSTPAPTASPQPAQ